MDFNLTQNGGQASVKIAQGALELPFPLVGDAAAVKAYGVGWPIIGMARRVTFVVARDLRVAFRYHNEIDPEAHVEKALAALRALSS